MGKLVVFTAFRILELNRGLWSSQWLEKISGDVGGFLLIGFILA